MGSFNFRLTSARRSVLSKVPGLVTYTNLKEQMLQISVDGIDPHAQTLYSCGDTNHCGWHSTPRGGGERELLLSPPQRLLFVNTRERNGSGSFNFSSSQPPRAAGIFFPRRDCRRPLRRREELLNKVSNG